MNWGNLNCCTCTSALVLVSASQQRIFRNSIVDVFFCGRKQNEKRKTTVRVQCNSWYRGVSVSLRSVFLYNQKGASANRCVPRQLLIALDEIFLNHRLGYTVVPSWLWSNTTRIEKAKHLCQRSRSLRYSPQLSLEGVGDASCAGCRGGLKHQNYSPQHLNKA